MVWSAPTPRSNFFVRHSDASVAVTITASFGLGIAFFLLLKHLLTGQKQLMLRGRQGGQKTTFGGEAQGLQLAALRGRAGIEGAPGPRFRPCADSVRVTSAWLAPTCSFMKRLHRFLAKAAHSTSFPSESAILHMEMPGRWVLVSFCIVLRNNAVNLHHSHQGHGRLWVSHLAQLPARPALL